MRQAVFVVGFLVVACSAFTDAATRLAYDLEAASTRVGAAEGARDTLVHITPSQPGECEGPYKVQFDHVGALIVWCYDAAGSAVVSSHSTTYHARFVDTAQTFIVEKAAGAALLIDLERRQGRVVVVGVR